MPIDTVKTTLQVDGKDGLTTLTNRVNKEGIPLLFNGALAASAATFVGHFPWFLTFNYLSTNLPSAVEIFHSISRDVDVEAIILNVKLIEIIRSAFIGLCASCASDITSNSFRVLKTYRQTDSEDTSYLQIATKLINEEGLNGLMGRGLQTRLLTNALQGMLFSVLFKYFQSNK